MNQQNEKTPKNIRCVVVTDKMNKTRVGLVERRIKHPLVGKYIRKSSRIMFHDEENQTKVGDHVVITPTRPLSAHKSYKLREIVGSA